MINFFKAAPPKQPGGLIWTLVMLGLLSISPPDALAKNAKYKQKSIVDFEDAVVEGKSRKPYSTYLAKEGGGSFNDVNSWEIDFTKRLKVARIKAELAP